MKRFLAPILFFASTVCYAQPNHWETAVDFDDVWEYVLPSADPSITWTDVSFSAGWTTGQGGIGFGDGDDNTTIGSTISMYQRILFNISDTSDIGDAVLDMDYDDAFVAYLNGIEIARSNVGTVGIRPGYADLSIGQHEASIYAGGQPESYIIYESVLETAMQIGTNCLAIQIHNATAGSSDMSSNSWLTFGVKSATNQWTGITHNWFTAPIIFSSSDLPIVVINTNSQTIPDDPKITVDMGIIYNGPGMTNYLTNPHNAYSDKAGIELRGSSSQSFPKKGYGFETRDITGANNNVPLFGWPAENDWVLHGPYSDKSLMRNYLAYRMSAKMGHYAPRVQFVELVIDGDYRGVYLFTEKIKRDNGRVDIAKLDFDNLMGDSLTGGYIFKIDKTTGVNNAGWTSPYQTSAGKNLNYLYHYPEPDDILPAQAMYIEDYVTDWEDAMVANPNSYATWIKDTSFIDYFLVNEVSKNVDGYRISTYMHKDKDSKDGRISIGPVWDYNLGFGNANYCDGELTDGWAVDFNNVCGNDNSTVPFWWDDLLTNLEFSRVLSCRWDALRLSFLHTDSVMAEIDATAAILAQSQVRNFNKWPVFGTYVWPNNYVGNTYAEEITYIKDWITARLTWMDANMFGTSVGCQYVAVEEQDFVMHWQAFPVPFGEYVNMHFELPTTGWTLHMRDVSGRIVADLSNELVQGANRVQWAESGLSSGIYVATLIGPQGQTQSYKIVKQ